MEREAVRLQKKKKLYCIRVFRYASLTKIYGIIYNLV